MKNEYSQEKRHIIYKNITIIHHIFRLRVVEDEKLFLGRGEEWLYDVLRLNPGIGHLLSRSKCNFLSYSVLELFDLQ